MKKTILLLLAYIPFQLAVNPTTGVDLASVRIFILVLFLLWGAIGLKKREIFFSSGFAVSLIISFLFLCIISLFFAENINWGLRKLVFLLSIFPLYFIVSDLFSRRKIFLLEILKTLSLSTGMIAVIGLIQFLSQFFFGVAKVYHFWSGIMPPFLGKSFSEAVSQHPSWLVNIGGHTVLRATAFFPDPHMLAFYLGINVPIVLSLFVYFKQNKDTRKTLYFALFLLILSVDLLTFSRGGYLGVFFGLLFFFVFYLKKYFFVKNENNLKLLKKSFVIGTISLSLFFLIPNPVTKRLISSFDLREGSNIGRLQMWKKSSEVVLKNPFFGVGLGNYAREVKPSANYREPIYAHNTYLDIASETGLINVLIWIIILFYATKKTLLMFKKTSNILFLGVSAGIVVFATHSFFETAIYSVRVLPLILVLLAIANTNLKSDNKKLNWLKK